MNKSSVYYYLTTLQIYLHRGYIPTKMSSDTTRSETTAFVAPIKKIAHTSLGSDHLLMKHKGSNQINHIAKQIREELTEEADIDITGVDISSLTWMITQHKIARYDNDEYKSIDEIIPTLVTGHNQARSFSILDIGAVIRQYRLWRRYLPEVEAFYAVKCNPDPIILRTLSSLGAGFDVASPEEIEMAIKTEVDRSKLIYANPCKDERDISYARSQKVDMMTFDNEDELLKIARLHPKAKLILRIVVDDITSSKLKFGSKFGCPMYNVKRILNFAKFHNLNIIGVSFHVGSGCMDGNSYYNAIRRAKAVFNMAKKIGYDFTILDIGGGFPGSGEDLTVKFANMAEQIQNALKTFFSDIESLRVIAEPGRFFATSALTHIVRITGKKQILLGKRYDATRYDKLATLTPEELADLDISAYDSVETPPNEPNNNDQRSEFSTDASDSTEASAHSDVETSASTDLKKCENTETVFHYNIDSSLYGIFNNIIFDKASVTFKLLNSDGGQTYKSVIFGQTCDSLDMIVEGVELPELVCGDLLYVENHGAYTTASASSFNGFSVVSPTYIFTF